MTSTSAHQVRPRGLDYQPLLDVRRQPTINQISSTNLHVAVYLKRQRQTGCHYHLLNKGTAG